MISDKPIGYLFIETGYEAITPQVLREDRKTGAVTIRTILQTGDEINRNKRMYIFTDLCEALRSDYIMERIRTKSWYGEAGRWPLIAVML